MATHASQGILVDTYGPLVRHETEGTRYIGFIDAQGDYVLGMATTKTSFYVGEWMNSEYDGMGIRSDFRGWYCGEFSGGVPHGVGEFVSGTFVQRGIFTTGIFIAPSRDEDVVRIVDQVNTVCQAVYQAQDVFESAVECRGNVVYPETDDDEDEPLSLRGIRQLKSFAVSTPVKKRSLDAPPPPTAKKPRKPKNPKAELSSVRAALLDAFDASPFPSEATRKTYRRNVLAVLTRTAPDGVMRFVDLDDAGLLDFLEEASWPKELGRICNGVFSCGLKKLRAHVPAVRALLSV